jgi:hypothetical protein
MAHVRVSPDIHKRLLDDRDSTMISANDVIRELYKKVDALTQMEIK